MTALWPAWDIDPEPAELYVPRLTRKYVARAHGWVLIQFNGGVSYELDSGPADSLDDAMRRCQADMLHRFPAEAAILVAASAERAAS